MTTQTGQRADEGGDQMTTQTGPPEQKKAAKV
jgi:hypothetical protein